MYIFGGIFELTHELNDLFAFDFVEKKFSPIGDCSGDDANLHASGVESPDGYKKTDN